MKKKIIIFGLLASASLSSALASAPSVSLTGGLDVQAGIVNENLPANANTLSANKKHAALNSSAHISVKVENTLDSGVKYGAKLGVQPTAKKARPNPSTLYVESDAGKLELGSGKSAMSQMRITGFTNSCATNGGWDAFAKLNPESRNLSYVTCFSNFLDQKLRSSDQVEYSRKITYFTPKFSGMQIGVSYIPDSANVGYASLKTDTTHTSATGINGTTQNIDIKNGVALGVTYERELNSDTKFELAVAGERGHVAKTAATADEKLKNLSNYIIGGEIFYKNWTLAASYSNYRKSLTSFAKDGVNRDTYIYAAGAGYKHDKLNTSLNYFYSDNKKNRVHAVTLAADYDFAPGLTPYAEVTRFKTNGRYLDGATTLNDKRSGTVLILGTKIKF